MFSSVFLALKTIPGTKPVNSRCFLSGEHLEDKLEYSRRAGKRQVVHLEMWLYLIPGDGKESFRVKIVRMPPAA